MKRIKRFGIYQTAKVFGIIYFLVSAVILIPIALILMAIGSSFPGFPSGGGLILIFLPFIYGFIGFVVSAIGCAVYNAVASRFGGFEFEFEVEAQENQTLNS